MEEYRLEQSSGLEWHVLSCQKPMDLTRAHKEVKEFEKKRCVVILVVTLYIYKKVNNNPNYKPLDYQWSKLKAWFLFAVMWLGDVLLAFINTCSKIRFSIQCLFNRLLSCFKQGHMTSPNTRNWLPCFSDR